MTQRDVDEDVSINENESHNDTLTWDSADPGEWEIVVESDDDSDDDIILIEEIVTLSGTSSAQGDISGDITIEETVDLSGSVTTDSEATGSVVRSQFGFGEFSSDGSSSGDVLRARNVGVEASSAGNSTLSPTRNRHTSTSVTVTSSIIGIGEIAANLSGSTVAQSDMSATPTRNRSAAGLSVNVSLSTGAVQRSRNVGVEASSVGNSTLSAIRNRYTSTTVTVTSAIVGITPIDSGYGAIYGQEPYGSVTPVDISGSIVGQSDMSIEATRNRFPTGELANTSFFTGSTLRARNVGVDATSSGNTKLIPIRSFSTAGELSATALKTGSLIRKRPIIGETVSAGDLSVTPIRHRFSVAPIESSSELIGSTIRSRAIAGDNTSGGQSVGLVTRFRFSVGEATAGATIATIPIRQRLIIGSSEGLSSLHGEILVIRQGYGASYGTAYGTEHPIINLLGETSSTTDISVGAIRNRFNVGAGETTSNISADSLRSRNIGSDIISAGEYSGHPTRSRFSVGSIDTSGVSTAKPVRQRITIGGVEGVSYITGQLEILEPQYGVAYGHVYGSGDPIVNLIGETVSTTDTSTTPTRLRFTTSDVESIGQLSGDLYVEAGVISVMISGAATGTGTQQGVPARARGLTGDYVAEATGFGSATRTVAVTATSSAVGSTDANVFRVLTTAGGTISGGEISTTPIRSRQVTGSTITDGAIEGSVIRNIGLTVGARAKGDIEGDSGRVATIRRDISASGHIEGLIILTEPPKIVHRSTRTGRVKRN